ncbi:Acetyl-CoA C-acyltransferase [Sulfidibacter corallicola]|uniref:acetyl-CoA C-acyltransferase n=1 Tax=Sulfidibacter corallicola TaxID=2818388 RepID=A0A8A4TNE4_SULCO|nr:acetyl-CoA C-acyltransferase [Sulfidibacter corallicola]QTD51070.1 acetyl-CoA C-acyltransferase [Sulfidibacter corallicola]
MGNVYVVSTVRTPVGKANKGSFVHTRPDDLAAVAMKEAVDRAKGLNPADIEDIILGCAMPEAEQGMNVARIAQMRAGLPDTVPALTINRFCASGLQAIAFGADRIKNGDADAILAGGTETMSMIPMGGNKIAPNPYLVENAPEVYINMGLTAEKVAEKYDVSREDQDGFALESHNKALKAIAEGRFEEEIVPVPVTINTKNGRKVDTRTLTVKQDEGPRASDMAGLAKLKPAFKMTGSVTAGNSSQMSDGAAAAVLMSERKVEELGLKPMARFVDYATTGCRPEIMGIGPALAVPKLLDKVGLKLEDIGLFELNEAFAAQSLMVIRDLGLNEEIVNVNGGAIALGHPLGCTGAKLTATLVHEMRRRDVKYGIVTMCVGGGMGAAGLFELVS